MAIPLFTGIQFFIGVSPITDQIPFWNCELTIEQQQAIIDAAIINPNVTITILSKDDTGTTFKIDILTPVQILSIGTLVQFVNGEPTVTEEFIFTCTLPKNKLLVISKMLAGLKNNP